MDLKYQKYVSSTDLLTAVKQIKESVPEVSFMCTGLSAFGEIGAEIGAGGIKDGWFDIAGFGRQAHPEEYTSCFNKKRSHILSCKHGE